MVIVKGHLLKVNSWRLLLFDDAVKGNHDALHSKQTPSYLSKECDNSSEGSDIPLHYTNSFASS